MSSSLALSGRRRRRPKSFSSAQRWTREGGRLCRVKVKPAEPMPPTAELLPPIALQRDSGLVLRGAPRREVAATRMPSYLLGACIGMTNEDPDAIMALRYHMRSTRLTCRLVCRAWALAVRTGAAWSCAHVWTKSWDRIHPDVAPYIRRLKLPYTRVADDTIPPVVTCSQFPRLESLDIAGSVRPTSIPALSQLCQLKALNLGFIDNRHFSDDEWMAAERLLPKSLEVLFINYHSLGVDLPSLTTLYNGSKTGSLLPTFQCPRLVDLDLSGSHQGYGNDALEVFVQSCPNIRLLNISKGNVREGVGAILSRMTSLKFLGARRLYHVRRLRLACPALEHLVIGGKNSMSLQSFSSLDVSACPRLRIVSARFLDDIRAMQLSPATDFLDLSHGCIPLDLLIGVLAAHGEALRRVSLIGLRVGTYANIVDANVLEPHLQRLRVENSEVEIDRPIEFGRFAQHTSTSEIPLLDVRGLLPQPYTPEARQSRL